MERVGAKWEGLEPELGRIWTFIGLRKCQSSVLLNEDADAGRGPPKPKALGWWDGVEEGRTLPRSPGGSRRQRRRVEEILFEEQKQ